MPRSRPGFVLNSGVRIGGNASLRALYRLSPDRAPLARLDVGLLPIEDRAALRLLNRIDAATPSQLATLLYPSSRTAYRHLRRLWQAGLLERAALPLLAGVAPIAYRLSAPGRLRLGYGPRRTCGIAHLRHTLDINEVVCALVTTPVEPGDLAPVAVWLPESIAADAIGGPVRPDSVLILRSSTGSGVVCLEMDEATEHGPEIRSKLAGYDRALAAASGWHLLFVAPTVDRLAWLDRVARSTRYPKLDGRCWAAVLDDVRAEHAAATAVPIGWSGEARPLAAILSDPRPRLCPTPVGSPEWASLLGAGGGEDLGHVL